MHILHIFSLIFPLCMASCATNTGVGVISGGSLGAGIGGISAKGTGAVVGGAAGLLAGGLIGYVLDEQDRKVMEKSSPRTVDRMDREEPLTLNDVIKLSQSGVSDATIMQYIQEHKTTYNLTQTQVRRLRDAGVSGRVIHYMQETER